MKTDRGNISRNRQPDQSDQIIGTSRKSTRRARLETASEELSKLQDQLSELSEDEWLAKGILDENETQYLIEWEGVDPATGQSWTPDWQPKENASEALVVTWESLKRENRSTVRSKKRFRRPAGGFATLESVETAQPPPKRPRGRRRKVLESAQSLQESQNRIAVPAEPPVCRASDARQRQLPTSLPISCRRNSRALSVDNQYRTLQKTNSNPPAPQLTEDKFEGNERLAQCHIQGAKGPTDQPHHKDLASAPESATQSSHKKSVIKARPIFVVPDSQSPSGSRSHGQPTLPSFAVDPTQGKGVDSQIPTSQAGSQADIALTEAKTISRLRSATPSAVNPIPQFVRSLNTAAIISESLISEELPTSSICDNSVVDSSEKDIARASLPLQSPVSPSTSAPSFHNLLLCTQEHEVPSLASSRDSPGSEVLSSAPLQQNSQSSVKEDHALENDSRVINSQDTFQSVPRIASQVPDSVFGASLAEASGSLNPNSLQPSREESISLSEAQEPAHYSILGPGKTADSLSSGIEFSAEAASSVLRISSLPEDGATTQNSFQGKVNQSQTEVDKFTNTPRTPSEHTSQDTSGSFDLDLDAGHIVSSIFDVGTGSDLDVILVEATARNEKIRKFTLGHQIWSRTTSEIALPDSQENPAKSAVLENNQNFAGDPLKTQSSFPPNIISPFQQREERLARESDDTLSLHSRSPTLNGFAPSSDHSFRTSPSRSAESQPGLQEDVDTSSLARSLTELHSKLLSLSSSSPEVAILDSTTESDVSDRSPTRTVPATAQQDSRISFRVPNSALRIGFDSIETIEDTISSCELPSGADSGKSNKIRTQTTFLIFCRSPKMSGPAGTPWSAPKDSQISKESSPKLTITENPRVMFPKLDTEPSLVRRSPSHQSGSEGFGRPLSFQNEIRRPLASTALPNYSHESFPMDTRRSTLDTDGSAGPSRFATDGYVFRDTASRRGTANEDPLSNDELIVALPLEETAADLYRGTIKTKAQLIKAFMQDKKPMNPAAIGEIKRFLHQLHQITTHLDLFHDETATQTQVTAEEQAKWDVACSSKFRFLQRLLELMRDDAKEVVIIPEPGRMSDILATFLQGVHITSFRPDTFSRKTAPGCTLLVLIMPSDLEMERYRSKLRRSSLILGLHQTNSSRQLLKSVRNLVDNVPVIDLVVVNTPEHIERCIQARNTHPEIDCLKKVVGWTVQLRKAAGDLPYDFPGPLMAAEALYSYVSTKDAREWKLPKIGNINVEEERSEDLSEGKPVVEQRAYEFSAAQKRRMVSSRCGVLVHQLTIWKDIDDAEPTKRLRLTPQPDAGDTDLIHHAVVGATAAEPRSTANDNTPQNDVSITHISDSVPSHHFPSSSEPNRSEESKATQPYQDLLTKYTDASLTLTDLQFQFESVNSTVRTVSKERDEAVQRLADAQSRIGSHSKTISELKTEVESLQLEIDKSKVSRNSHF